MKRAFVVIASAVILAILLIIKFNINTTLLLCIALFLLILAVFLFFRTHKDKLISAICFLITFCCFVPYSSYFLNTNCNAVSNLPQKSASITATVIDEPQYSDGYTVYYLNVLKTDIKAPDKYKLRLVSYSSCIADYGDTITSQVVFKQLTDNQKAGNNADGYFISATTRNIDVVGHKNPDLYSKVLDFKNYIFKIFNKNLKSEISGIPIALLTGNTTYLSDTTVSNIRAVGMSHCMAVSGMHISIICMSFLFLLRKLNISRRISALFGMLCVFFIAAVAGFSGSVMRAGFMYLIIFLGDLFLRKADGLNSLSFAAVIILLINPYNLFSVSFLMSSSATLGILLFSDKTINYFASKLHFGKIINGILKWIISYVSVSMFAVIFVLPISLFTFGYISFMSILAGLLVSIPISVCMITGILAIIFSFITPICGIMLFICGICSKIFLFFVNLFADLPFVGFFSDDIFLYVFLLIFVLCLLIIYFKRDNSRVTVTASICIFTALILSSVSQLYFNSDTVNIYVVDSQKDNVTVIQSGRHFAVVGECTDYSTAYSIKYLLSSNMCANLDSIVIPTSYSDNLKYSEIIKLYKPQYIFCDNYKNSNTKVNDYSNLKIKLLNSVTITAGEADCDDLLISINGDNVALDFDGNAIKNSVDTVITHNGIKSSKKYKSDCFIVGGDYNDGLTASHILTQKGKKCALTCGFGDVKLKKYSNNNIKYSRK